jgi:hypothetical protein
MPKDLIPDIVKKEGETLNLNSQLLEEITTKTA